MKPVYVNKRTNKHSLDLYYVENNHEWAQIFIDESDKHGSCGTISIVSTFGNLGHYFSNIGGPNFRRFLIDCDFSYLMEKLTEYKLMDFDFDLTMREFKSIIMRRRRNKENSKGYVRMQYEELLSIDETDSADLINQILQIKHLEIEEPWEFIRKSPRIMCIKFWEVLWLPFIEKLKVEVSNVQVH